MINLLDLKKIALAAVISAAIGFQVGYYVKGQFVKADLVESVAESRQDTASGIQLSVEVSQATESKIQSSDMQVGEVRRAVAARLKQTTKENTNEEGKDVVLRQSCVDAGLDVGTVRLLNGARDGSVIDPAGLGDDESKAPSGIGLPELLDNDLEIVQLYRELAVRHDTLVDYVESVIKQQANQ